MAELAKPIQGKVFEGVAARVHGAGDPLPYPEGPEYRDLAELKRVVELLPGTPVTLLHPDAMLAEGGAAKIVGKVLAARMDGNEAVASFIITDAETEHALAGGIREISLGYYSALDGTRHQRRTKMDHFAVVPYARCGAACRVRTDAVEAPHTDCAGNDACQCGHRDQTLMVEMRTRLLDSEDLRDASSMPISAGDDLPKEHSVNLEQALAALAAANEKVGALTARADAADQALVEMRTRADNAERISAQHEAAAVQAKKDADDIRANAQAQVDAKVAEIKAANEAALAAAAVQAKKDADERAVEIAARVSLLTNANAILGATDAQGQTIDRSAVTDAEIKTQIVKHVDGLDVPEGKHPAYLDAMYVGAVGRAKVGSQSLAAAREAIGTQHRDGAAAIQPSVDPERAADQATRDAISNAWQKPAK